MTHLTIPLLNLPRQYQRMKEEIDKAIQQVLSHQRWILGPEVEALEKDVAEYLGISHAVGVASGTDALILALRALAWEKKGKPFWDREDEIITTPFTFVASASSILHAGGKPVFVDVDPETFNMDIQRVKEAITPKTVGMVVVHIFGLPVRMEPLLDMAREHNLFIVEDCAQAFGAEYKEKKVGTLGDVGIFSFFPSKNLGGFGDGGMVVTNAPSLHEKIRVLHRHGGQEKYNVQVLGYNSRLDTLQASILRVRLKYVDEMNQKRRALAEYYRENIRHREIKHPREERESTHVYHQYTVRVSPEKRDHWMKTLKEKGIATAVYYPHPLHTMELFQPYKPMHPLTNSEKLAGEVLSLPVEPYLTEEEKAYIVSAIESLV